MGECRSMAHTRASTHVTFSGAPSIAEFHIGAEDVSYRICAVYRASDDQWAWPFMSHSITHPLGNQKKCQNVTGSIQLSAKVIASARPLQPCWRKLISPFLSPSTVTSSGHGSITKVAFFVVIAVPFLIEFQAVAPKKKKVDSYLADCGNSLLSCRLVQSNLLNY